MCRKQLLVALAGLAVAVVLVPVASADKPVREFVPAGDFTGSFCPDFDVLVHTVTDNEYALTFSSGATIITGTLKVELTNLSTGKTIPLNASGPGFISADGNTFVLGGRSFLFAEEGDLYPGSPPYLLLNSGRMVLTFDPDTGNTSVDLTGASTDLCAALAGA